MKITILKYFVKSNNCGLYTNIVGSYSLYKRNSQEDRLTGFINEPPGKPRKIIFKTYLL